MKHAFIYLSYKSDTHSPSEYKLMNFIKEVEELCRQIGGSLGQQL
jgi:hypothetical protein